MQMILRKRITNQDLTQLSRKLATLVSAGIPLVRALHLIAESYSKGPLYHLLHKIKRELERGQTFSVVLKKYPRYFNPFYTGLIEVGELSGTLDVLLIRLAANQEKNERLKRKLKTALVYPMMILLVAIAITVFLLIFIVPVFKEMFQSFNLELPLATKILLKLAGIIHYGVYCIPITAIVNYILFKKLYKTHTNLQHFIQRLTLQLPFFGPLIFKAHIASITRILAITEVSGVPLNTALETLAHITRNIVFLRAIHHIQRLLAQGQRLEKTFQSTGLFPMMVCQMIGIGEESGMLATVLEKLSGILDEELESTLGQLTTLIEPLMMIFLGLLVGGLVIALYLPIFNMGSIC